MALGCLAALWTASRRGLKDGIHPEKAYDVGWWLLIGVVIGARGLYVLSYWNEEFADKPLLHVFNIRQGGLIFYGGFIGACAGVILYCVLKKEPLWRLADMFAPSISLGNAFGRFGCLMTGCCYGRECQLPWAIHFPADHATHGLGVHPTQIYDSLLNLAGYAFLAWAYPKKKFDGQIFSAWLLIYPVTRSFTESFRGDYPQRYFGGVLTPAHLLSIALFSIGVALYVWLPRTRAKRIPSHELADAKD